MCVARVIRTDAGVLQLDPQYIPPLLDFSASDYLCTIARRLVEILAAKSSILAGVRRQKNLSLADFGTADIARKNWQAIALSGNGTVAAVASRSPERSRRFVTACQASRPLAAAPAALGSYEELLARSDVDAVYLPLPTGVRKVKRPG